MVRKKQKKVLKAHDITPSASNWLQQDDVYQVTDTHDLPAVVHGWLRHLGLTLDRGKLPEATCPQLDVFAALRGAEGGPYACVRSLQTLRASVQKVSQKSFYNQDSNSTTGTDDSLACKTMERTGQELRLVFLVSLLLYMDPDTGPLRKAIKALLLTVEKAAVGVGSDTDSMVEVVFDNFLRRSLEIILTAPDSPETRTTAASRAISTPPNQDGCKKSSSAPRSDLAMRTVASLQWLVDTPGGKRVLLGKFDGFSVDPRNDINDEQTKPSIFGRSIVLIDCLLEALPPSDPELSSRSPAGHGGIQATQKSEAPRVDPAASCENKGREREVQVAAANNVAVVLGPVQAMECRSEILKTAACLMSLNKSWDIGYMAGGQSTALRIGTMCLHILSSSTANREAVTHASNALINLAIASWRHSGLWPRNITSLQPLDESERTRTSPQTFDAQSAPSCTLREPTASRMAATTLKITLHAVWKDEGLRQQQGAEEVQQRICTDDDRMSVLLASYMPLPADSTLGICRAIVNAVSPRILLESSSSSRNEMISRGHFGKNHDSCSLLRLVLRTILQWCGPGSGLQLRLHALQVLEAWFARAKILVEAGYSLEWDALPSGRGAASMTTNPDTRMIGQASGLSRALSDVVDLIMEALVHPSKLISSMGPVLLAHIVNLRQMVSESPVSSGPRHGEAWEGLVERVLGQPVSAKGRYIALSVLVPRIGAPRMLEICPSLVEQLVWAVGARGNVSGHATSLLLQLLTSAGEEPEKVNGMSKHGKKAKSNVGEEGEQSTLRNRRDWWVAPAAGALTQGDVWARGRVGAYLLPEIFKLDPHSVASLFAELRKRWSLLQPKDEGSNTHILAFTNEGAVGPDLRCMWAMLEVVRHARKAGVPNGAKLTTGCDTNPKISTRLGTGLLHLEEVEWAALHSDEVVRTSAISLLCTDPRITTVPSPAETSLLLKVLPYSLKIYEAQNRQLLLRALQILLSRMRETVRVCEKVLSEKGDTGKDGNTGCRSGNTQRGKVTALDEREKASPSNCHEGYDQAQPVEAPADIVSRVEKLTASLCQAVLESLYPGCPFEREVLGLEILQLVLSELLLTEGKGRPQPHGGGLLVKVVSSSLFCRRSVDTLLSLLSSSWDRTRSLSYNILAKFPRPLAGYEGQNGAMRLSKEGLRSSGSGRQRESERGAFILRLVYVSFVRALGLHVPLRFMEMGYERAGGTPGDAMSGVAAEGKGEGVTDGLKENGSAVFTSRFMMDLCSVLAFRLDSMERSFDAIRGGPSAAIERPDRTAASSPLKAAAFPHGIVLTIHYLVVEERRSKSRNQAMASSAVGDEHGRDSSRTNTVIGSAVGGRSRRRFMDVFLRQALRALKLSLLIVGEDHDGTRAQDLSSATVESDVDEWNKNEAQDAATACSSENHDMRMPRVHWANRMGTGSNVADSTAASRIKAATAVDQSSRSVNANGHMGGVSVGSGRLHSASEKVRTRPRTLPVAIEEQDILDGIKVEARQERGEGGAAEGQRAVVGAWLLAKETCCCLATIVSSSRLQRVRGGGNIIPATTAGSAELHRDSHRENCVGEEAGCIGKIGAQVTITSGDHASGAHAERFATGLTSSFDGKAATGHEDSGAGGKSGSEGGGLELEREEWTLSIHNVTEIGQALLEALLALKHMGCVASAQAAFQTVCEVLLQEGEQNPALSSLPSMWLHLLLDQLTGAKQEFVLRRSAGLATAFVAILRAEPRSVAPVFLPRGMRRLLSVASLYHESQEKSGPSRQMTDWKGRVHALNVLQLVFIDSTLADDIGDYVTEATMAAVCGFEDAEWAVRNSSMMLFASIMQRAVGGAKNAAAMSPDANESKKLHSARGAVTARTFFQQHPRLHPFLLAQLERATSNMRTTRVGDARDARGAEAEMHPVLYPILLLLSRLRNSSDEVAGAVKTEIASEDTSSPPETTSASSAFIPLIIRCGGNPHFLARVASARALAALVPPTELPAWVMNLLRNLPKDPAGMKSLNATSGAHNQVHGTLLQVLEIVLAARAIPRAASVHRSTEILLPHGGTQKSVERQSTTGASQRSPARLSCNSDQATCIVENGICFEACQLLWLAQPSISSCAPIRYAMLRVLEGLADWLDPPSRSDGKRFQLGAADARDPRRNITCSWREARELNLACISEPKAHVPGQSLLLASVVAAVVRDCIHSLLSESNSQLCANFTAKDGGSRTIGDGERRIRDEDGNTTGLSANEVDRWYSMLRLLSHPNTDVRDAAIKAAKKVFGPLSLRPIMDAENGRDEIRCSEVALVALWRAGAQAVVAETHPPNIRRLLRLLSRVRLCFQSEASLVNAASSVPGLWQYLCRLCGDSEEIEGIVSAGDVHAGALEVMGILVRASGNSGSEANNISVGKGTGTRADVLFKDGLCTVGEGMTPGEIPIIAHADWSSKDVKLDVDVDIQDFAEVLEFAANPGQPVSARVAAAQSLEWCGLLLPCFERSVTGGSALLHAIGTQSGGDVTTKGSGAQKARSSQNEALIRIWFVLLSLLQDHDERVRERAARVSAAAGMGRNATILQAEETSGLPSLASQTTYGQGKALREVQVVLQRLRTIAQNGARNGAGIAEVVALALLKTVSSISNSSAEYLSDIMGPLKGEGERGSNAEVQHYEGMGEEGGDIFGKEQRSRFEEPALFARVSAPYIGHVLSVLVKSQDKRCCLPKEVMQALTAVLENGAAVIEELNGHVCKISGVTWFPGVFEGVMACVAVSTTVLQFCVENKPIFRNTVYRSEVTDSVNDAKRLYSCGQNGVEGQSALDVASETSRVARACSLFVDASQGDEGIHPDIVEGVARMLCLAKDCNDRC